jgi:hypothetical protein
MTEREELIGLVRELEDTPIDVSSLSLEELRERVESLLFDGEVD